MEHTSRMRNQKVPAKDQLFELQMLQTYSFNESAFATTLTPANAVLHQAMPLPACDWELRGCYSTLKATRQQTPKQALGVPSHTPHPCSSRKGWGCDPYSTCVQCSSSSKLWTQDWRNQKFSWTCLAGPSLTEKLIFQYSTAQQATVNP